MPKEAAEAVTDVVKGVVGAVGGVLTPDIDKPKTSGDTIASLREEEAKARDEQRSLQEDEIRRRRALNLRQAGRLSLFSGSEQGIVPQKTTLG